MIKFSFVRLPKYFVKVVLAWRAKTLNLFPAILANADVFPPVAFLTNRKVRVERRDDRKLRLCSQAMIHLRGRKSTRKVFCPHRLK